MGIAVLVTWLITVSIGAHMLRTWIARDGPRIHRARDDGLPPVVVYGHACLAVTGLVVWIGYVASHVAILAWSAAGLLMPVIALGVAMVTVWTPYPAPASAGAHSVGGLLAAPADDALAGRLTDEVLARALTDDVLARRLAEDVVARMPAEPSRRAGKSREHLAPLLPACHGVAALTTFFLATLTAVSTR